MEIIDDFLQDIWLDCCGHMSGFEHKNHEISMDDRVEDVFQPRMKIFHDYDYGTTTRVMLKSHKHYQLQLEDDIILLSRNEPLKIICGSCNKKPAMHICTACWFDEYAFFCEQCSEKHASTCEDFNDYGEMPVVNSPEWVNVDIPEAK